MKKILFLSLLLVCSQSWADSGGWHGSGGGTFKDEHNPWFVRNTTDVSYCIDYDAASFSASLNDVRSEIQGAIDYWKNQFSAFSGLPGSVAVATQTFHEVDCATGAADIRFVMGYGKLTQEEVDWFKDKSDPTHDVTSYIGVTVRTSYDQVNLKGKGFVYISSDMGAHVYQNDGNLITQPWLKPHLLQYALIHETGHVFGFPHTGTGIMSEVFLEQILDSHLTDLFQNSPIDSFLFPANAQLCFMTPQMVQFWAAPATAKCLSFGQIPLSGQTPVYASDSRRGQPTQIGALMGIDINFLLDLRSRPGIFLHLTSQQKVFTDQETGFRPFMVGPSFIDFGAKANYVPTGGTAQPVYIRVTSSTFTVTGMMGNKLDVAFSYISPIDLLLTQH